MEALLAESDQLRRVMENPSIPGEQKRAVLDAVMQKVGGSRPVRNFIAVVTDHRRLPLFSEIVKQVEQELNDRFGFAEAQVTQRAPAERSRKAVAGSRDREADGQASSGPLPAGSRRF